MIFTARRYASAIYAVIVCPSVCLKPYLWNDWSKSEGIESLSHCPHLGTMGKNWAKIAEYLLLI